MPYDAGRESLYEYFKEMHKPTQKICDSNSVFLDSLNEIDKLYIFGHSHLIHYGISVIMMRAAFLYFKMH